MPSVKGLDVLNDCQENKRILQKLPDWLTTRWNRTVTERMSRGKPYPIFKDFVTFLQEESKVANNPISSLGALRLQDGGSKTKNKSFEFRDSRRS